MELMVIPVKVGGEFRFMSDLSVEKLKLINERSALGASDDAYDNDEVLILSESPTELYGCWWYSEPECAGSLYCECGPVTLLDVLSQVAPGERQRAIDAHLAHLSGLYIHYWAAEGLTSHTSNDLTNACAMCIIDGAHHVEELLISAQDLATELGEALASHHSSVVLGPTRY